LCHGFDRSKGGEKRLLAASKREAIALNAETPSSFSSSSQSCRSSPPTPLAGREGSFFEMFLSQSRRSLIESHPSLTRRDRGRISFGGCG
jgi:hypothetical protein